MIVKHESLYTKTMNRFLIPIVAIYLFFRIFITILPTLATITDITQKLLVIIIALICVQSIFVAIYHLDATPLSELIYSINEKRKRERNDEL